MTSAFGDSVVSAGTVPVLRLQDVFDAFART